MTASKDLPPPFPGSSRTVSADGPALFRASAQDWDERVAALDPPLEDIPPPPALWDRISAAVDAQLNPPGMLTVRAGDGAWETVCPGVTQKILHIDHDNGWQALLLRMEPESVYPAHGHDDVEECLVLDGEFEFGGHVVRKGDLHLAFPGGDHPEIYSRGGATLYIRTAWAA